MLSKLWNTHKQVVILGTVALLIAVVIVVILCVPRHSKKTEMDTEKKPIQTEQSKDETKDDSDHDNPVQEGETEGIGLDVKSEKDNDKVDTTDTTNSWDEALGDKEPEHATSNPPATDSDDENTETEQPNDKDDDEILKDNITWGDIY